MGLAICVYCSSSGAVAPRYASAARELGRLVGQRGHALIYGGGGYGLMGLVAEAARSAGARVTGVLPQAFVDRGITGEHVDELVITRDLRERKAAMEQRADAFVALPGGFGTLEELLEILTLRQLGMHEKAVAVVNTGGFYDPLVGQFERLFELRFAKADFRSLYRLVAKPEEAVRYLESYVPAPIPLKWTEA